MILLFSAMASPECVFFLSPIPGLLGSFRSRARIVLFLEVTCGGDFATLIRRCRGTTLPFAHDARGALWAVRLPRLHAGDWSLVLCMRRTAGLWHRPSSNVRFAEFYLQTTVQQEIRNPLERVKCRVLIREVTGSKPISMFRPRAHGPSCSD